ncbi:MAG: D-alanine--D-alanine ligase [Candidatus Eisenbacteria bacterium]|nr:D-alanine--D-alanine ligase [Candidatus Eisenbacteria bacterium]
MKITVLYGGHSAEREVSLKSGGSVARALESRGHGVTLLDTAAANARLGPGASPAGAVASKSAAGGPAAPGSASLEPLRPGQIVGAAAVKDTDVVFIALHGGEGENGTLQALLDLAGVPYTGSGMLSSALAMDKRLSKELFARAGIPTPEWVWLKPGDADVLTDAQLASLGGWPIVVKPNDQGSTIGLSVIQELGQLAPAVDLARRYSADVLVERFIPGREMSVPVICGEAYPVIEIRPTHGIYDYECKYTKGLSNYLCPAPVSEAVRARLQELSVRACAALGCAGAPRVDFRLTPDDEPFCLEVNTIPGMTETSLVPMSAKAAGLGFDELVERLCLEALRTRGRRAGAEVT